MATTTTISKLHQENVGSMREIDFKFTAVGTSDTVDLGLKVMENIQVTPSPTATPTFASGVLTMTGLTNDVVYYVLVKGY